jgi:methylglutaconyl-CoA hydratase
MLQEFGEALRAVEKKKDVAGVVVTGAGEAFSAGADLRELKDSVGRGVKAARRDSESFLNLLLSIHRFPKPIVAAVDGPAIGGGCGIVSACDLVLASEKAIFGYGEVTIGFVPALVSVFLSRIVGDKKARELLFTGRIFTASEGVELGLVNRLVPSAELASAARDVVGVIAQNSLEAVSLTKELLWEVDRLSLREGLEAAAVKNALSRFSADFSEGVAAFLEKRKAKFKGD